MQSHTVPQRLLEQFAYDDLRTRSKRLWRYSKGLPPYWKASPKTATGIDGHFSDSEDAAKEAELETRLNREFEDPVNHFLCSIDEPGFVADDIQRKQLTFYVQLLFHRSEARRKASVHLQEVSKQAIKSFVENDSQVLTVAAKWNIDYLLGGRGRGWLVTKEEVIAEARACFNQFPPKVKAQGSYIRTIETLMSDVGDKLLEGEWNYIRTVADDPFIISDAPVVTWERLPDGRFNYGIGFHRANVEVLLPISPLVCVHLLPNIKRTVQVVRPSVREVNTAQAAFTAHYCFSNTKSAVIDDIFQANFGVAEINVKCFTVWHRDYSSSIYDILMNGGRWVEPGNRAG